MMMKAKTFLFTTVWGIIAACGQGNNTKASNTGVNNIKVSSIKVSNTKVDDVYKPVFNAAQINERLESSFTKKQTDSFGQIFMDWHRTVKPNTNDFIYQNDTIVALYNAYQEFYKPFDLLKLGDWEWGNDLNAACKYAVIQNKILFSVSPADSLEDIDSEHSRLDSITNFRPPLNLGSNAVLYLTEEYAASINKFLGTESTPVGRGNIMNPSHPKGQSEKRYEILRQYIPIIHGHWGGYWHLATHPEVSIIMFNKSLSKAKIYFRVGYQGGAATMERNGAQWTIKESKATWIE